MSFNVSVRPARGEDRWALLEWMEDCEARRAFHQRSMPDREAYRTWFDASLQSEDGVLLIGSAATLRIGAVRLVRGQAGIWQATLMLKAAHWGGDYGVKLLRAAVDWLDQREPGARLMVTPAMPSAPIRRLLAESGAVLGEC